MDMSAWVIYALLSAFFAALVAIFGKIGIKDVNSNLAVAIRTIIIVIFAWVIVILQYKFDMKELLKEFDKISRFSMTFIVLSAIATGLSWLFYFKALQLGEVSRVAPIDKLSIVLTIILAFLILGEKPSLGNILGGLLITLGVFALIYIK